MEQNMQNVLGQNLLPPRIPLKIAVPEKKYMNSGNAPVNARLTIANILEEAMQDGKYKYVLYFKETEKGLVLNATNRDILIEAFTDTASAWFNRYIILVVTKTKFNDRLVDSIQVMPQKE